jgi:hypothetical protein
VDDFVVVLVEVGDYGLLSKLGLVGSVNGNIGSRWASTCFLITCWCGSMGSSELCRTVACESKAAG